MHYKYVLWGKCCVQKLKMQEVCPLLHLSLVHPTGFTPETSLLAEQVGRSHAPPCDLQDVRLVCRSPTVESTRKQNRSPARRCLSRPQQWCLSLNCRRL